MAKISLPECNAHVTLHLDHADMKHPPPASPAEAVAAVERQWIKLSAVARSKDQEAAGPEIARRLAQIAAICIRSIIALDIPPADPRPMAALPETNPADDHGAPRTAETPAP